MQIYRKAMKLRDGELQPSDFTVEELTAALSILAELQDVAEAFNIAANIDIPEIDGSYAIQASRG